MPARRPPRTPVHDSPAPAAVLARLRALADPAVRAGYPRFGIVVTNALGIAMRDVHAVARSLGTRHDLADALWASGIHEARLLVAFVADPARLTAATMDRWCRTFDNWAVVDTLCFKLFDRTPHAWAKIAAWRTRTAEFAKRAAFALLASVALHDRTRADADFLRTLPWIEAAASDPRNFVKKGVVWALAAIGTRNGALLAAARATAARLAASDDATARWVGRNATRQLARTRTRGRGDATAAAVAPKRAAAAQSSAPLTSAGASGSTPSAASPASAPPRAGRSPATVPPFAAAKSRARAGSRNEQRRCSPSHAASKRVRNATNTSQPAAASASSATIRARHGARGIGAVDRPPRAIPTAGIASSSTTAATTSNHRQRQRAHTGTSSHLGTSCFTALVRAFVTKCTRALAAATPGALPQRWQNGAKRSRQCGCTSTVAQPPLAVTAAARRRRR